MSEESSFQKGFGGGCGLILGVILALIAIPVITIGGCIMLGVGTAVVAPAVHQARDAARRVEAEQHNPNTTEPTSGSRNSHAVAAYAHGSKSN